MASGQASPGCNDAMASLVSAVENMNKKVDQAVGALTSFEERVSTCASRQPAANRCQPMPDSTTRQQSGNQLGDNVSPPAAPWCSTGNLGYVDPAVVGCWLGRQDKLLGPYPGVEGMVGQPRKRDNDVMRRLWQRADDLSRALNEKAMQLDANERTMWQMQDAFQNVMRQNNHLRQCLGERESACFRMDHRIRQLEAEVKDCRDQLDWKEIVLKKTRQTASSLQKPKESRDKACSADLDHSNSDEMRILKDENDTLKRDVESLDCKWVTQIEILQAKMQDITDENAKIDDECVKIRGELETETRLRKDQGAEFQELKKKLFTSLGRSEMLDDEIQALRSENKKLSDLCDAMSMKM